MAQLIKKIFPENPCVPGSNPGLATIFNPLGYWPCGFFWGLVKKIHKYRFGVDSDKKVILTHLN